MLASFSINSVYVFPNFIFLDFHALNQDSNADSADTPNLQPEKLRVSLRFRQESLIHGTRAIKAWKTRNRRNKRQD